MNWAQHLVILPVALPMLAGALMILLGDARRGAQRGLALLSALGILACAVALVVMADAPRVVVYRLGDWPSTFGIVLVLDRLSALMVLLASLLGLAALVFAMAGWDRRGAHFHPLFQFQVMGLSGAFLTGDLFNLFVFFEVMLAASYGLALHGSGTARVRAGLHYVVVNLVASLLFLVGVSVVYGIAGTLNMADLAARMPEVVAEDRALLEAGLAVMGVAFLVKAAMWPLGFWLAGTYAAAAAPAGAILSLLSKVGIYAILRVWLLVFGGDAGASAGFGGTAIALGGLLTLGFGAVAVLATQDLARLAGASVIVSSGTLLAAIGLGQPAVTAGALFYLAASALGLGALFLLTELVERGRGPGADVLAVTRAAYGTGDEDDDPEEGTDEVGIALPRAVALLGAAFLACALLLAGLPPLPGFLGKFAVLHAMLAAEEASPLAWPVLAGMLLSGLATLVAMLRVGVDVFWAAPAATPPRVRLAEAAPVAALLLLALALVPLAGPAMAYLEATAAALHGPGAYLSGVAAATGPRP